MWSAAEQVMGEVRRLRGVGIGAGYFAPFQYEAWTRIPEVEVVAIYNRTEERARGLMKQYGIPRFYGDWKEMLARERPDFVDIITPPETHEEMCAFAAAHGIHIICQKPLAPTYEASKRIVDASASVRFMVHENFRWQPWYRAIKDVQVRGDIGDFTHVHFIMRMADGWAEDSYLARQPFFAVRPDLKAQSRERVAIIWSMVGYATPSCWCSRSRSVRSQP